MRHLALILVATACAGPAEGLRATPQGTGPMVVVDWDAEPLPEVPFPNDLSTKTDPTTRTGLRVNIPLDAPTHHEDETRRKLNELDGFGVYGAIQVQFDAPLDIDAILAAHPDDFHRAEAFDDDLLLVIDVTEGSPTYGQPVPLDLGHGRYPYDAFDVNRYFANDPKAGHPALIFDTIDEDVNDNGELDPGEDLDDDGLLDIPNVWPPGGDIFEDLLTFYDLQSNTLIARPAVPMLEGTTYAVVLTERLVGLDGAPIRSPWDYVHHTRQTGALEPLIDILPEFGLDIDDVGYAWTFTTGTPTADLRDIQRGLVRAEGPFAWMAGQYPAGIDAALQLSEIDDYDNYNAPIERFLSVAEPLDLIGQGAGADLLARTYLEFADRLVGGSFTTPYLMGDTDDAGRYDADESWQVDWATGSVVHDPRRVVFSCILPKETDEVKQPFDVVIYGHGYGSSRAEFLLFAPIITRMGKAACSMDFPNHGASLNEEEFTLARDILGIQGLGQLLTHFFDARARDLDNDGDPDSGGDQWTSDSFHTRDMVRQAVVDWMQWIKGIKACGTGEMDLVEYGDTAPVYPAVGSRLACDFDDDGVPDIGGPDGHITMLGGSLGGINLAVGAPVLQDVDAFAPIVPGGGLVDVGLRTRIGGAVEAFVGRFLSPLVLGLPTEDGGLEIVQLVNSVTKMRQLHIATIPTLPVDGEIHVTNLDKGTVTVGNIPADGRFRIAIATDAAHPGEKAILSGIPETGPEEGVVYTVPNNAGLGDELIVEIYEDGKLTHSFDSWEEDVLHEGVTYLAGSPLVAGSEGNGRRRGEAVARRQVFTTAMALEPGDPIAYAPAFFERPFEDLGYGPRNVLVMPTPGDDQVPINAGIAVARAAGLVDFRSIDERYGTSVDRFLIDRQVVRGAEERGPYTGTGGTPVLFDADDYDNGTDGTGAPSDEPLRLRVETSAGVSGLSLPYVEPTGIHGFREPDPEADFDINAFSIFQVATYLTSGGTVLRDDPCMATGDCPDFAPLPEVTE